MSVPFLWTPDNWGDDPMELTAGLPKPKAGPMHQYVKQVHEDIKAGLHYNHPTMGMIALVPDEPRNRMSEFDPIDAFSERAGSPDWCRVVETPDVRP